MIDRIEVSPAVHFGKPCVAGTRIPVQDVLELVREGISFDTILADYYPDLSLADVRACRGRGLETGPNDKHSPPTTHRSPEHHPTTPPPHHREAS